MVTGRGGPRGYLGGCRGRGFPQAIILPEDIDGRKGVREPGDAMVAE